MHPADRAEESRRLEELYAHMGDEELQVLAGELSDLTEVAQHALRAEAFKRGLPVQTRDAPTRDVPPRDDDVSALRAVGDPGEARLIKTILESAGIACLVDLQTFEPPDGSSDSPENFLTLRVAKSDVERAVKILNRYFPRQEPVEKEFLPRCPVCSSPAIVLQGVDAQQGEGAAPDPKYSWTCDACGHKWVDDGVEREV